MTISDLPTLGNLFHQWGWPGVAVGMLLFFLFGFRQNWWHTDTEVRERDKAWRERFEDLQAEKETWRTLALSSRQMISSAVEIAETQVKGGSPP